MPPSALLSLPRELRDMIVQYALDSRSEPGFSKFVHFSRKFAVTSGSTIPANLLSACQQLRAETLPLMESKAPKLEIHIIRTRKLWEIGMVWVVPPSACTQFFPWRINCMEIDIKPRNTTDLPLEKYHLAGTPQPYATSQVWRDELFGRLEVGDVLGYLATRAIQSLGTGQNHVQDAHSFFESIPRLYFASQMHYNPNIVLKRLRINVRQCEQYPGTPFPTSVMWNLREDVLNAILQYVNPTVACCSSEVQLVQQMDKPPQSMCYCRHRRMWYSQVGDVAITDGEIVGYRINLAHILNTAIRTTGNYDYRIDLQQIMALREFHGIDHVHPIGPFRHRLINLPAGVCSDAQAV